MRVSLILAERILDAERAKHPGEELDRAVRAAWAAAHDAAPGQVVGEQIFLVLPTAAG